MSTIKQVYRDLKQYLGAYVQRGWLLRNASIRMEGLTHIRSDADKIIGRYSFIARGVVIGPSFGSMGMFCSVGQDAILGPNHHNMNLVSTSSAIYKFLTPQDFILGRRLREAAVVKKIQNHRKTNIGHDVWIGARAIILPGVTIGTGAVIGAGSVVTKDVQPYAVVAGNPGKLIRLRFSDEVIDKLQNLDIFSWDHEDAFSALASLSDKEINDENIDDLVTNYLSKKR